MPTVNFWSKGIRDLLIGEDPLEAVALYDRVYHSSFYHGRRGTLIQALSGVDIALWDLIGRMSGVSVKTMLGGYRDRLPTYASTYHGQESAGGLNSPEVFADYALACKQAGFHGFKIHGWNNGDVARELRNVRLVRERVGDDWRLMLDPACQLRTWMDALTVGRACDEAGFFWYEDPYRDAAVSAFGHKRLREQLKTPLLISEHVRGLEQKTSFLIQGGCDMIHADPEYDMGITGCMKIAHLGEALGLDVQIHAAGPAQRHAWRTRTTAGGWRAGTRTRPRTSSC